MFGWGLVVIMVTSDSGMNKQDEGGYFHDLCVLFFQSPLALMWQFISI